MPNPEMSFRRLWLLTFLLFWLPACSDENPTGTGSQSPVLVLFPDDRSVLLSDFIVTIGTEAVDSMTVSLDDSLLARVTVPPFTLPIKLSEHSPGEHDLAVTAYFGNSQKHLAAGILMCRGVGREVGNFAPTCSLEDMEGVTHNFQVSHGAKLVLLDFWATWCPPCVYTLPETQRLFEEYGDDDLKVLTITGELEEIVQPFIRDHGYTFPVLMDTRDLAHYLYDVRSIPTFFLIDHRGVVRYVQVGGGGRPLEEVILELLQEQQ